MVSVIFYLIFPFVKNRSPRVSLFWHNWSSTSDSSRWLQLIQECWSDPTDSSIPINVCAAFSFFTNNQSQVFITHAVLRLFCRCTFPTHRSVRAFSEGCLRLLLVASTATTRLDSLHRALIRERYFCLVFFLSFFSEYFSLSASADSPRRCTMDNSIELSREKEWSCTAILSAASRTENQAHFFNGCATPTERQTRKRVE